MKLAIIWYECYLFSFWLLFNNNNLFVLTLQHFLLFAQEVWSVFVSFCYKSYQESNEFQYCCFVIELLLLLLFLFLFLFLLLLLLFVVLLFFLYTIYELWSVTCLSEEFVVVCYLLLLLLRLSCIIYVGIYWHFRFGHRIHGPFPPCSSLWLPFICFDWCHCRLSCCCFCFVCWFLLRLLLLVCCCRCCCLWLVVHCYRILVFVVCCWSCLRLY